MKILIAEDDDAVRGAMKKVLEMQGCEVLEARDGREGLELAAGRKPDLIVSDALMPGMDGYQFLRNIKMDEALKSIPFVFYSAVFAGDEDRKLALSLGADAFIVKPRRPDQLWDELQSVLARSRTEKIEVRTTIAGEKDFLKKHVHIVAEKLGETVKELEKGVAVLRQKEVELERLNGALREAEDKFHAFARIATDAIILADASGTIVFWNNGASKIFGYAEEEAVGRTLTNLMPERYREAHTSGIERVRATGRSQYLGNIMELTGVRKDGSEFPLELSITIWPTREETFFMGVLRDITQRKRMEKSLQEQKMFAEKAIRNSAVATFVLDPRHRVMIWNRACEELTGVSADDMIGTDNQWKPFYPIKRQLLADIIIEGNFEDMPALYGAYGQPTLLKDGLHAEGWRSGLNGRDRYIIFDAAPICDSQGELIAVIQTLQDITERKKAEENLTATFSLLSATLESTADGILVVDGEGKIVSFNRKFLKLWLIPEHIMTSRDDNRALAFVLEQLKSPDEFLRKVRELYAQPGAESFDLVEFNDGRIFERYSKPQQLDGKNVGRVWSFRDITKRRKAEEEIKERMEELEKFYEMAVGRELKMKELKEEVARVKAELSRYKGTTDAE